MPVPPTTQPDRTIKGVDTSIALFIGRAIWGPTNKPHLCYSYSDFEKVFTSDTSQSDLARAVYLFFINGGNRCYVVRTYKGAEGLAATEVQPVGKCFTIKARYSGKHGNTIQVDIKKNNLDPVNRFDLKIFRKTKDGLGNIVEADQELWQNLSMNHADARYFAKLVKSNLIDIIPGGSVLPGAKSYVLNRGLDSPVLNAEDYSPVFEIIRRKVDQFNLLILPRDREHTPGNVAALWAPASELCKKKKAFLLIDAPDVWQNVQQAVSTGTGDYGINALRQGIVRDQSAVFFPKLKMAEGGKTLAIGPVGAIAGLMARVDAERGVWKSPAGKEATIKGISGIALTINDNDNGLLNPRGINAIRMVFGGIVNWGARTLDGDDNFASQWKYIAVRRTALFIEESIYRGLKWASAQPNNEALWAQIRLHVGTFLQGLFVKGALQGQTAKAAYYVKCDSSTITQNDIARGNVIVWVGFAPLKPAEFVTLKIECVAGQPQ
jgi:hypothetical protein